MDLCSARGGALSSPSMPFAAPINLKTVITELGPDLVGPSPCHPR